MKLSKIVRPVIAFFALAFGLGAYEDSSGPKFTPRAQQAMALARRVAIYRQKALIETDDFLAGICALKAGLGYEALSRCRISPLTILADLKASEAWQKPAPHVDVAYDDSVKILLALAVRESRSTNAGFTGTDHLLIAMFDSRVKRAYDYFRSRGVSFEEIDLILSKIRNESDRSAESLPSTTTQQPIT